MAPCCGRRGGFTLLEVLVVTAIVAALAAIAYPVYERYAVQAHRSDATGSLLQAWSALERCFAEELDYRACADRVPGRSRRGYYELALEPERDAFELIATPAAGGRQEADAECQRLTLNHRGERGSEPAEAAACWGE